MQKGYSRLALLSAVTLVASFAIPAGARDLGVDVSHHQVETGIPVANWQQMFSEGDTFTYIKASDGLTGPDDPAMAANVANAGAAGLLTGVYHFCEAQNRPTPSGAVQEADHLLAYAGSAISPGHLRPALDVEGSALNLTPTALSAWVVAFCNEIVAHRGVGATPIIYTSSLGSFTSAVSPYDVWIATGGSNPQTGNPPSSPFADWAVWQYNIGSAGGISPIDLDVLHNESNTLAQLTIPAPEPASAAILLTVGAMTIAKNRRRSV